MYLKSLEMIGFKSFADRTTLQFLPGMTAIVGPNGCGKSNIADAIKWVLGEQSAKAMRGSNMVDCIFNGTDARKPLGMAEVSITFTDCEKALGMEFHEVTLSRRVFRTGEGQYFINKTPCRLKDIQRMFMDTGVGTTSYSILEQGRIDQVLSSHPEDRRTIFEEASGITKFKTDKKEAIRKLEYTEANLLRLADVIREVKRQIGSLQRQAGKARRYKELRDELVKLDVYVTREKVRQLDADITRMTNDLTSTEEKLQHDKAEIDEMEQGNTLIRRTILQTEHEIGALMEKGMGARNQLEHSRELIAANHRRIEEYADWARRDAEELDKTRRQIEEQRRALDELAARLKEVAAEKEKAEQELKAASDVFAAHQRTLDDVRLKIQERRTEAVDFESRTSRLQNELTQIESTERADAFRKERLFAEKAQLEDVGKRYERRQNEMRENLSRISGEAAAAAEALARLEKEQQDKTAAIREFQKTLAELASHISTREAKIEILGVNDSVQDETPAGSRQVLDQANPLGLDRDAVLGLLAAHVTAEPEYRIALEAVLRAWTDTILVRDVPAAVAILGKLESARTGSTRLLAVHGLPAAPSPSEPPAAGTRLADHVRASEAAVPVVGRLLARVVVLDTLSQLPSPLPAEAVFVTRSGSVVRGDGRAEFWLEAEGRANLLERKQRVSDMEKEVSAFQARHGEAQAALTRCQQEETALRDVMAKARTGHEEQKHAVAVKEGEMRIVSAEAEQNRDRLNTVTFEIESLTTEDSSAANRKASIAAELDELRRRREDIFKTIEADTARLRDMESQHTQLQETVTRQSIRFAQCRQEADHLGIRHSAATTHLGELQGLLDSRTQGIASYEANIQKLKEEIAATEGRLEGMERSVAEIAEKAESLKKNREKQAVELENLEQQLSQKRMAIDEVRTHVSNLNIKRAELIMRRQNQVDRMSSEYNVREAQLMEQPDPQWEGEKPSIESIETTVAELKTKIEAMGPVNTMAIEEYQELEERYTFLTQQEQDLINSKQQLMDMIRKINKTTSEMFATTFAAVNENFDAMFKKLFNGGSSKLVLVNEEDVLECGIEIIARPPGKRLQNITLLSGGERTLTAVALLFAIYQIKPSPFCLLDELDAPLDESNIGRFVAVLQDFLRQSQFVVITHNRQTISAGDVLYGITMPEKGISKIVSMRFNEEKKRLFDAPKTAVGPAIPPALEPILEPAPVSEPAAPATVTEPEAVAASPADPAAPAAPAAAQPEPPAPSSPPPPEPPAQPSAPS